MMKFRPALHFMARLLLTLAFAAGVSHAADAADAMTRHVYHANLRPVRVVASTTIDVGDGTRPARLPVYASADLDAPQPNVTRAIIMVHGMLRNAKRYYATLRRAAAAAGQADAATTLLVAPQFLATLDMVPRQVNPDVLHWHGNGWMAGVSADGPVPLSSYAALDGLLARLADRAHFPRLRTVVLAGHSGGAQMLQRYAIAARGLDALTHEGIRVRFLLANPSSYAYFDNQRPQGDPVDGRVTFAPYRDTGCPGFDDWKYGMANRPPYLADRDAHALEAAYVARDITYLIGGADTDPAQKALDKSCPAEAEGSERFARATAYYAYLKQRHPALAQRFSVVPGVGHNEARMLDSACARHVMFGAPGCMQ